MSDNAHTYNQALNVMSMDMMEMMRVCRLLSRV